MSWLISVVGLVLLFLIIQFARNASVKGFTRGIAKAQLRTFHVLKGRNPNTENRELYLQMISNRPNYNREIAEKIIERTERAGLKNTSLQIANKQNELKLRDVVLQVVWYDYYKRTGQSVPTTKYLGMEDTVNKIIPEEL